MYQYVKIVVISLLVLCLQHLARILYLSGYHVTVYNHTPGPCRLIPGVDYGSEDIETLPNGLAFISSGLLMSVFSDNAKSYYADHNVQGKILLFDYNAPEKDVTELKFTDGFDLTNFVPHGISLYQSPETGRIYLFVVNHASGMDGIEKFEYHADTQTLEHLHSYMDEAINIVNDVAATGENSFYYTNYAHFRNHLGNMMEIYLLLPFGSVWYYDGKDYSMVADGLVLANGIQLSKDYQNVYAANSILGILNVYQREENNSLTLEQEFELYSMPDNINVHPETGNLIIAANPAPHMMAKHMGDPEMPSASKVLMPQDGLTEDSLQPQSSPCKLVPGIEHGSEDMETLPNGQTFISSVCMSAKEMGVRTAYELRHKKTCLRGFRPGRHKPSCTTTEDGQILDLGSRVGKTTRKHYQDQQVSGKIFLFDFKNPDNGATELKITGDFDTSTFIPHGVSLHYDSKTERTYLFVVNHPPDADRIEKFEYIEKDQSLKHVQSYSDKIMRVVNDVAATGDDSFYFTDYNYYRGGLGHVYESLMMPALGSVVYYDVQRYSTVAGQMNIPNGVILSKDKKIVYVTTSLYGILNIYRRESDNSLILLQEFPMHSHLDNILIDSQSDNLLIGSHPVMYKILKHMDNPAEATSSQVLMVNMKDSSHADNMTELYSDDGHTLSGSTVAAMFDKKLLVGTVDHKLLYCEIRNL